MRKKVDMYIIRSLTMTNWLCNNGYKILKVEDSEKDSKLKVFFFENTTEMHDCMANYKSKR